MVRASRLAVAAFLLLAPIGCGGGGTRGGPGAECLRTSECDISQGLACVAGMCSTDLSGLAEAGMVAMMMDGGPVVDAPMMDAPGVDAPIVGIDGGMGIDSGPIVMDSGPIVMDSGATGTDGGAGTD